MSGVLAQGTKELIAGSGITSLAYIPNIPTDTLKKAFRGDRTDTPDDTLKGSPLSPFIPLSSNYPIATNGCTYVKE